MFFYSHSLIPQKKKKKKAQAERKIAGFIIKIKEQRQQNDYESVEGRRSRNVVEETENACCYFAQYVFVFFPSPPPPRKTIVLYRSIENTQVY
jgi:hypothetical protein